MLAAPTDFQEFLIQGPQFSKIDPIKLLLTEL